MPKIKEMMEGHEKKPAAPTVTVKREAPEKSAGPQRTEAGKVAPARQCAGLPAAGAPEQARQMVLLHRKVGTAHLSHLLKSTQVSAETPGEKGEGVLKKVYSLTSAEKKER
jgi:hypothetical protein